MSADMSDKLNPEATDAAIAAFTAQRDLTKERALVQRLVNDMTNFMRDSGYPKIPALIVACDAVHSALFSRIVETAIKLDEDATPEAVHHLVMTALTRGFTTATVEYIADGMRQVRAQLAAKQRPFFARRGRPQRLRQR